MQKKLGINTATGIINIVIGAIALIGCCLFWGACMSMAVELDPYYIDEADVFDYMSISTIMFYFLGWLLCVVSAIMSIISIVMSKKNAISMVGPIVALVGAGLNLFTMNIFGFVNGIVMIIGGVIGLLQKNIEVIDRSQAMPGQAPIPNQQYSDLNNSLNMNKEEEVKSVNYTEVNSSDKIASEDEWKL